MTTPDQFEQVVTDYYHCLYRFAYSLSRNGADATDLTQQAFYRYATKGDTIRDTSKTKSWLFRTVKNDFLNQARRSQRYQHVPLEDDSAEVPCHDESHSRSLDGQLAVDALQKVDEIYRDALSMFYMQELSYREIASALEVPIGTVMSRISRGKVQLKSVLTLRLFPA